MRRTLSEFMTPTVHTIRASASLAEARQMMETHGFHHLPVLEGGKLVGVLSDRDIRMAEQLSQQRRADLRVEDAMTQDVLTADPQKSLATVAADMAVRKVSSAVATQHGRVVGIFTVFDAASALALLANGGAAAA